MSLVADYSSDVSSSDEEITSTAVNTEIPKKTSLSSILPPSKATSKGKKDGPVKIVVDLPQINDLEEEENVSKKQKISTSSSLFALLPAPKRTEITNIKSINETKDSRDASAASNIIEDNVDSYTLAGASNVTDFSLPTDEYTYNEYYNNGQWQENSNSYIEYQGIYDESQQQIGSEQAQSNWELDDEMFQKLGGRRGKREGPIKIKEINAADQMADSWQSQVANLSKPTRGSSEGSSRLKPTRGQKRKHNLMYLAFHATAMENELKEQHASNKKTKRETQAKYGF
ncbi:36333_t:CDS:2 [Gigaspora margarita]|uniref:36333_t:CDS:1 n=2 Tax=Gigaspora margarita TaxID=4874 RepID=A0ABN7VBD2_GIGMA|nr:Proline-rich protein PRCC [Gigaspora margarita]CAG8753786.1 36333_t:CDS:2 [Gigaspora margarita]